MMEEQKPQKDRCGLLRLRAGWLHSQQQNAFKKMTRVSKRTCLLQFPTRREVFLSGQRTGTYDPSAHSQEWVLD